MSDAASDKDPQTTRSAPVVASVLGGDRVVINRGTNHGVLIGQRYLIYTLSEEQVTDPNTGEPLGLLEIPKGTGRIVHVQDRMAVLESDKAPNSGPGDTTFGGLGSLLSANIIAPAAMAPFRNPKVGDRVKRV